MPPPRVLTSRWTLPQPRPHRRGDAHHLRQRSADCGKYALVGNKFNLTPLQGKPWTADFKPAATPGNLDINSIPCQKITAAYPPNAKLNARYTAGVGFGGIRSVRTCAFNSDGTFSIESRGSVSAGVISANA